VISVSENREFISHPLLKENTVLRRTYQENIFINCLNHNCLVVIPTGLGKTIIALMLSVHRLTEIADSKIIFLAPTKPLVNQHHESFLDLTSIPQENLKSITGTIVPKKRKEIWLDTRIAFMTPQVLQNDIISGNYTLDDVALIIFDECHRAVGDYAYCFIAKKYVDSANNPQILALTASPGSTEEKINEIKQNLFIERVEIRTRSDGDVKPFIQKVENQWVKIQLPDEFLEIKKILIEKLKIIYKALKQLELLGTQDVNKISRKDLLGLDKIISTRIRNSRDDDEKFQLFNAKKLVANAIRISHMDELIEIHGINALGDYIEKNVEKIRKNTANKSLRELFADPNFKKVISLTESIRSRGIVHPKLVKLKDLLRSQIESNEDSRILVFCHFRDSVNNIVNYFKSDDLIRAHKFVGQQSKTSDKGLTQKEQVQILRDFKEGTYNVLIGTSVAEEGLDIAECDMVIFYDVIPSDVRSIQRRGRTGRNREGKIYILIAEGTRDESYYWAERSREKRMHASLKKMKKDNGSDGKSQSDLLNFISYEEELDSENSQATSNFDIKAIPDAKEYKITCDTRETASGVVRILSLMGLQLDLVQLPVADYVISERVGIERKSSQDFNDSITDGRLFSELMELKNNFEIPILILEGDPFSESKLQENAIYGAITSIILNLGITVYRTDDTYQTAMFLYQLAKKEQRKVKSDVKLRFDKIPIEISDQLEYIVAGIPGVNALRAKNLLNEFESLQTIFNADIGELMKVNKIGKKIAQEIYKLSRYKYKNENPE